MTMKVIVTAAGALLLTSAAYAADLVEPVPVAPPPVVEANPFNGFYAGIHAGYGWENRSGDGVVSVFGFPIGGAPFDYDQDGFLLGAQVGANWVGNSGLLIGAEVSASWADIDGSGSSGAYTYNSQLDAIGIAQAKLGWANHRYAIYATAGGALGHFDTQVDGLISQWNFDETMSGWTVGAGMDVMLGQKVSLGVSYNYIDFGSESGSSSFSGVVPTSLSRTVDSNMQLLKLNLNYNF